MKNRKNSILIIMAFVMAFGGLTPLTADAARIKELVRVRGVRSNPLIGYGLVVGLSGTGDTQLSTFTYQSLGSLLKRMGLNVNTDRMQVTNIAAVMVTAKLNSYHETGEYADVVVSAIGNARSLAGGTLIMTPLKGADGSVYALAQGPLTVGGYSQSPTAGTAMRRNTPTVGRVPNGAIIEKSIPAQFVNNGHITLSLKEVDFITAGRIVEAINTKFQAPVAQTSGPGTVNLSLPPEAIEKPVQFMAQVEALEVEPDTRARVVVNERTGTVVVGGNVTVGPAAVAHANLNISVDTQVGVSQPGALSGGNTVVANQTNMKVEEERNKLVSIPKTTTVDELVKSLNALGASPRDLIAILQTLKATGALRGDLVVQ